MKGLIFLTLNGLLISSTEIDIFKLKYHQRNVKESLSIKRKNIKKGVIVLKTGSELHTLGLSNEVVEQVELKETDLFIEYASGKDTIIFKKIKKSDIEGEISETISIINKIDERKIDGELYKILVEFNKILKSYERIQRQNVTEHSEILNDIFTLLQNKYNFACPNESTINKGTELTDHFDFLILNDSNQEEGVVFIGSKPEEEYLSNILNLFIEDNSMRDISFIAIDKKTLHFAQQQIFKWVRGKKQFIEMLQSRNFDKANVVIKSSSIEELRDDKVHIFYYYFDSNLKGE